MSKEIVADTYTLKITEYKGYLICQLNHTPKLTPIGLGSMINIINSNDVYISKEAYLTMLSNKVKCDNPAIEVLNKNKIFLQFKDNCILPPLEPISLYEIPIHKTCDNIVDINIKKEIDKCILKILK